MNARNVAADGDILTLRQTASAVTLQAIANLDLRGGPDLSFRRTETVTQGKLTIAIGRNHDGRWLETPKGWILASEVDFDGDTMALPVTFASITVTANKNAAFLSAPTWEAEVLEIFSRGAEAFANVRTADADWVKTPTGWVHIARGMDISGDLMSLPETYFVSVTALSEQNIYSGPGTENEITGILLAEQETFAMRRTEGGSWLEVPSGWISVDFVEVVGDVMRLPTIPAAIKIRSNSFMTLSVRTVPTYSKGSAISGRILQGEEALAIGRTEKG